MVQDVGDTPRASNGWNAGHTVVLCLLCVITALGVWRWCHTGNANSAALVAPIGALELLRRRHAARAATTTPDAMQTPTGIAKPSQQRPFALVLRVLAVVLLAAGLVFGITTTVSLSAVMDQYAAVDSEVGVTVAGIDQPANRA